MIFGGNNKRQSGPIGVAVTTHDVRLAQAKPGGYRFEHEPLAPDVDPESPAYHNETSRAIATAFRRGDFQGRDTVSALPAEMLRYKTLRLPPMPDEDLAQAIAWEAAERFQLTDNQSLQHYRAGAVAQGNEQREEVILLAAEKQAVYDHAVAVKRAGLEPVAIDATGAALTRLFGTESGTAMIVHMGKKNAEIVGTRDGQVIFDKPIDLQIDAGQADAQALARELNLCMRYLSVTFGVHKPDNTWVCGEAVTPVLTESLGEALRAEVQMIDQSQACRGVQAPGDEPAMWAVAIGLSLRGKTGQPQRGAA